MQKFNILIILTCSKKKICETLQMISVYKYLIVNLDSILSQRKQILILHKSMLAFIKNDLKLKKQKSVDKIIINCIMHSLYNK